MKKLISLILIGVAIYVPAQSQGLYQGLSQPIDARGWGMSAAIVAQTRSSSGVAYNPAILPLVHGKWQLSYTRYVLDIQATNGLIVWPAPWKGNLAAMVGYLDYGRFNELDENRNNLGEFTVSDLALRLGYGVPVTRKLSAGFMATMVSSDLAEYRSQAFLGSLGLLYYDAASTLSIGLAYANFGKLISGYLNDEEPIQPQIMAGVSKKLDHLPMVIAADLMHYSAGDYILKIGGEFIFRENYFIRWGTSSRRFEIGTRETMTNFFRSSSVGGGLIIKQMQIDLTWLSLGHTGRIFAFSIAQNI